MTALSYGIWGHNSICSRHCQARWVLGSETAEKRSRNMLVTTYVLCFSCCVWSTCIRVISTCIFTCPCRLPNVDWAPGGGGRALRRCSLRQLVALPLLRLPGHAERQRQQLGTRLPRVGVCTGVRVQPAQGRMGAWAVAARIGAGIERMTLELWFRGRG